jgi:demethylmenaquinone methyltransferase/2-methoxy-6-polyprenyl-1,4-benzoquinol methylase
MKRAGGRRQLEGQGAEDPTPLLQQQIDFYEADAAAYQAWLDSLAADENDSADAVAFRASMRALAPLVGEVVSGRVLELAAGTGLFSQLLAQRADELVLVDSSPASLEIARNRLAVFGSRMTYLLADLFSWVGTGDTFDAVCFAAWLHHVPEDRFDGFWSLVGQHLAPDGRVLFNFATPHVTDDRPVPPAPSIAFAAYHDATEGLSIRDLGGQRWTVVHQVWEPSTLEHRLRRLGWNVELRHPDRGFQWVTAQRHNDGSSRDGSGRDKRCDSGRGTG